MALFKPVATKFGSGINASYHRIENPAIVGKDKLSFSLVSFFTDPKEAEVEPMIKAVYVCDYNMDSQLNPFQQGYAHIKALPEWGGVVDC